MILTLAIDLTLDQYYSIGIIMHIILIKRSVFLGLETASQTNNIMKIMLVSLSILLYDSLCMRMTSTPLIIRLNHDHKKVDLI